MIEPLSILLKSIDNKPATLLRNQNGKTIARVYDDEYTPLFLAAERLLAVLTYASAYCPDPVTRDYLAGALADYNELRDIHFPVKGSVA